MQMWIHRDSKHIITTEIDSMQRILCVIYPIYPSFLLRVEIEFQINIIGFIDTFGSNITVNNCCFYHES